MLIAILQHKLNKKQPPRTGALSVVLTTTTNRVLTVLIYLNTVELLFPDPDESSAWVIRLLVAILGGVDSVRIAEPTFHDLVRVSNAIIAIS